MHAGRVIRGVPLGDEQRRELGLGRCRLAPTFRARSGGHADQVAELDRVESTPRVLDEERMVARRLDRVARGGGEPVYGLDPDGPDVVHRLVAAAAGLRIDGLHVAAPQAHHLLDGNVAVLLGEDLGAGRKARLAEVVGFGERVSGEALGDAHDLFLVDRQAVGAAENLLGVGVQVGDLLATVLAVGVVVVHVRGHGTRAIQGDERGHVLEAIGPHRTDERAHRWRLELEHADGVATTQQLVGLGIVERHVVDVDIDAAGGLDEHERVGDDIEVAQPEEVHLEQTELFDTVHLVLRDDGCVLDVAAGLGFALDRQVLGERILGDHHRGSVYAVLAAQSFETARDVDDLVGIGVVRVHVANLRGHLEAVLELRIELETCREWCVSTHDQRRHGLRDLVADDVRIAEHARRVAHRGPRFDLAEGHDLGDVVAAVALGGVTDHLVAITRVEVHVDIRHRHATRVEEPLEQQVVLDRIQVGDAQAVGHRTARGRATPRSDSDVATTRVRDEIADDEKVRAEAHVADDLELVREALDYGVGQRGAPPGASAFEGEVLEVLPALDVVGLALLRRELSGQRELGQLRLAELDLDVAPLGDPQRVVARLGNLGEHVAHLRGGLEVVLVAGELEAIGVAHERTRLHAQQRVVGDRVVTMHVMAVVGGEQRRFDAAREVEQHGIGAVLFGDALVLDLDEEVVATKDVLEPGCLGDRSFHVAPHERLKHVSAEAPCGGDEPLAVVGQRLPVDAGLVVVALHVGARRQLDEVLVADVVLGQEREVVVELGPAVGVAARVVDPAATSRTLVAALVRHVRLGAEDGRNALLAALLVEVEDAIHVAVIGDAEGRLPVRRSSRDQLAYARRAIEHRELGVDMQMGERVGHATLRRGPFRRPPESQGCHSDASRATARAHRRVTDATWLRRDEPRRPTRRRNRAGHCR
ncbi:unannotated protein [freshwater metagenome]|uniref:Unannotated protein n=1 Tax=freshwater metagenome TaxID=449393 RepID=A0A6J7ARS8_9ZZZZ